MSPNPSAPSNLEKSTRQTKIGGHSANYGTNILLHCQGHQKQGRMETLSQPRGAEGDVTTKCNGVSCMGTLDRTNMSGRAEDIQIEFRI